MSRAAVLAVLIVVELLAGGAAVAWRLATPVPPEVDWSRIDPGTATDLQTLRQQAGRSAERWLDLGEAYLAFGFLPESEACLTTALDLDPDSFEIRYARGYALQRLGRLDEAIDQFRQAAEIAPAVRESACWYHIGRCALRKEAVDEAENAFGRHPNFPPSAFQLAKILVRSARVQEAAPILDELDRRFPGGLQTRQLRMITDGKGSPAERRRLLETATEKLQLTDHHQYLGPARFRYGAGLQIAALEQLRAAGRESETAAGFLELMKRLNTEDRNKLAPMLAELQIKIEQPDSAEQLLTEYFETAAVTPHTLMLLGDSKAMRRNFDEALAIYERVLAMRPGSEIHGRLALSYDRLQKEEKARFHAARRLSHEGIEAFGQNELPQALESLGQAVQLDPGQDLAWFYLGETLMLAGSTADGKRAYEECLKINPNHGRAAAALETAK